MQTIEGFQFFRLLFDKSGAPGSGTEFDGLKEAVATAKASDVLFIAHGFRNDEQDAAHLYTAFMKTLRAHLNRPEFKASLSGRRLAIAGVFWPSQQYPESVETDPNAGGVQGIGGEARELAGAQDRLRQLQKLSGTPAQRTKLDHALALLPSVERSAAKQDEFVALVLSLLDGTHDDPTEGGQRIRAQSGSDLLDKLGAPVILPTVADDGDEGGVQAVGGTSGAGFSGFFQSFYGRVNQLLNFTTWYLMKDRAGVVGAAGVADAVRAIKAARADVKVHLVGHSLGGRLVAAAANALCTPPPVQLDSLILLEAAFSHYGFSPNNGHGIAGQFRDVIAKKIVKGPMVATYSVQDTVVGYAYAIASRLAGDNAKAIGDAKDEFGGLGRNGAQLTKEAVRDVLHAAGKSYTFPLGVLNSLDGSGGLIKDHGDVANETVTYAVAAALAQT